MLKREEISEIAKKLDWEFRETKGALKELFKTKSLLRDDWDWRDWRWVLKLCVEAKNPYDRTQRVIDFLHRLFTAISMRKDPEDILLKTIPDLLSKRDPCFRVLAFFNFYDSLSEIYEEPLKALVFFVGEGKKSFLNWSYRFELAGGDLQDLQKLTNEPLQSPFALTCQYINSLIENRTITFICDLDALFFEVFKQVGFLAFHIRYFCNLPVSYTISQDIEKLDELKVVINDFLVSSKSKQRQYWTIFVLVEKLRKKYRLKKAWGEIGTHFSKNRKTIQVRYYEMKSIAKKEFLKEQNGKNLVFDLNAIMRKYYLIDWVNKCLKAIDNEEHIRKPILQKN